MIRCSNLPTSTCSSANYIRLLPVELLQAIFGQCITVKGVLDPLLAPLLICQVCSTWRAVAMDFPELWDTLLLRLPDAASFGDCISSANTLRFWLKNSGKTSSLSFSFRYRQLSDPPPSNFSLLDSIIASHSGRFRRLELKIESNAKLHHFFSLPSESLQRIETLILDIDSLDLGTTIFQNASRLRKLSLSVRRCSYVQTPLPRPPIFPWGQLTHLTMVGNPIHNVWRDMFSQCLRLEYCSFCISFAFTGLPDADWVTDVDIDETQETTLSFPHLTVLKFAEMQDFALSLYGFSFPALATLEVRDSDCLEEATWLPRMAPHYGLPLHNLRRLSLRNNVLSIDHVLSILQATTSLVDFEFAADATMYHDALEILWRKLALVAGEDLSTQLISGIEILSLCIFMSPIIPESFTETLSSMIESRWIVPCVAHLRNVSLEFQSAYFGASEMAEDMRARLEPCLPEGFDLYIRFVEGEEDEDEEEADWRNPPEW